MSSASTPEAEVVMGTAAETAGLAYFNEVDSGGHFAAWEEPELFSTEMRAVFSSLR